MNHLRHSEVSQMLRDIRAAEARRQAKQVERRKPENAHYRALWDAKQRAADAGDMEAYARIDQMMKHYRIQPETAAAASSGGDSEYCGGCGLHKDRHMNSGDRYYCLDEHGDVMRDSLLKPPYQFEAAHTWACTCSRCVQPSLTSPGITRNSSGPQAKAPPGRGQP